MTELINKYLLQNVPAMTSLSAIIVVIICIFITKHQKPSSDKMNVLFLYFGLMVVSFSFLLSLVQVAFL